MAAASYGYKSSKDLGIIYVDKVISGQNYKFISHNRNLNDFCPVWMIYIQMHVNAQG